MEYGAVREQDQENVAGLRSGNRESDPVAGLEGMDQESVHGRTGIM